jgi:hypothetical protein
MLGLNGVSLPDVVAMRAGILGTWVAAHGVELTPGGGRFFVMTFVWIFALLPVVFLAPNSQQIMHRFKPALAPQETAGKTRINWQASPRWALAMAIVLAFGLLSLTRPSEFLYFQF